MHSSFILAATAPDDFVYFFHRHIIATTCHHLNKLVNQNTSIAIVVQ